MTDTLADIRRAAATAKAARMARTDKQTTATPQRLAPSAASIGR
jgi:hypothetical protein